MDLIKITDLTTRLGLSSRSLRYYEQIGLIKSIRSEFEKYRFYDSENIERLKQIIVLRKMQIPVRDILRIYESADMSVVVETFVNRIHAIDDEIGALAELKRITGDFLQTMTQNGVTKISALPLLYEEIGKQLESMEERKPATAADLNAVSERLSKPLEISIVALPQMRVISSYHKTDPQVSDTDGFSRFVQSIGIKPGGHERFEFQTDAGDAVILRVPDEFANDSKFFDYTFPGGLFASANVYLDEDLSERFRSLVKAFDENKYYQIDYAGDGGLRHAALLENLISPDNQRELVALYVPVKKRTANPALFEKPEEITPGGITIKEIETQNPILWTVNVPLDKLTPINNPHYRMTENGEAEFDGYIIRAVLNTNVSVKLPFRVDMDFRLPGLATTAVAFYHSDDTGYSAGNSGGSNCFAVNMGNSPEQMRHAITFHQPIFRDAYEYPGSGAITPGEQSRLTWIVGEKHLAVIINGEARYCGANFPYMSLDLSREAACPIVLGALGGLGQSRTIYFRSIHISQLAETRKNKIKQGDLTMITRQSNNIIPVIHRLVTDEYGENYWFNGCAKYVMECLGEKDYDYWFFAGLTGDIFTQHYTYTKYSGDALSSYMMDENSAQFVEETFAKCGYAATYVCNRDLRKNSEMYLQALIAYIDKGIPVIVWGNPLGVFVGYEDFGKVLLYITGNNNQPERIPLNEALQRQVKVGGWIFVGEKKESRPLAELYREAIRAIPHHFNVKTDTYCFGPEAFRAWARDIENGKFDGMTSEEFDAWGYHSNYVCVLATNGSCCHEFLKRARGLNPDMGFLEEVSALYRRTAEMWGGDRNRRDANSLEILGGGFNVTLEALQNKEKRGRIATKICECGDVTDEIVRVLNSGLEQIRTH